VFTKSNTQKIRGFYDLIQNCL